MSDLSLLIFDESREEICESSLEKKESVDFSSMRNKSLEEWEIMCSVLKSKVQNLESEKQQLIIKTEELMNTIDTLSQFNKRYYDAIGLLQHEKMEMRMEVDKLHTDSSVVIRERNMCSEDLETQKIVATDVKKHLEEEVDSLLKSNKHLRKTMDRRVEELLTEKKEMTSCIETLNEKLKEKEWKIQLATREQDLLRRENKEMEKQIGRLVHSNVQLQHEVKNSVERIKKLEEQNTNLCEQVNDLEWIPEFNSQPTDVLSSKQYERPSNRASTPPARAETFADEVKWSYVVPAKTSIIAKNKTYDALEEYLHLTAEAVKISFSNPQIEVTIDELLRKANKLPFYRVHDVLSRYMMEKMQWAEAQERKKLLKCRNFSANQRRSLLTKVRGLFVRSRKNPADRIRSLSCDSGFHHVVHFAPNEIPDSLESDGEWQQNLGTWPEELEHNLASNPPRRPSNSSDVGSVE